MDRGNATGAEIQEYRELVDVVWIYFSDEWLAKKGLTLVHGGK